jgi:hypothetical protein
VWFVNIDYKYDFVYHVSNSVTISQYNTVISVCLVISQYNTVISVCLCDNLLQNAVTQASEIV